MIIYLKLLSFQIYWILALVATCSGLPPDPEIEGLARQELPDIGNSVDQDWNQPDENGDYLLDDMILDQHQFNRFFGTEDEKELSRQARPQESYRWTNKIVPYKFHSTVTQANRKPIRAALKNLGEHLNGCLEIRY